jgi:hypothetical protein
MTAPEAYIHFVEEDYADDGTVLPRPTRTETRSMPCSPSSTET